MTFEEARVAALTLLNAQGRAKNSELLAVVGGDQALLGKVREDLILNDVAYDKDGAGLVAAAKSAACEHPSKTDKIKIFISYGRRDASDLVDRLCVDLTAAGFNV